MIYLIRHAQSHMNLAKVQHQAAISQGQAQIVWDRSLIDAPITPSGEAQVASTAPQAWSLPISKVYVSPLLRALQTCKGLFSQHPMKPEVVVLPYLAEIISDAGDIPAGNYAHKDKFSEYDWSLLADLNKKYWVASVTDSVKLQNAVKEAKDTDEIIDRLCGEIAKAYPSHFEAQSEGVRRAQIVQKYLTNVIKSGQNVAVVGHRDLLRSLMRLYLPPNEAFLLQNCQIYPLPVAFKAS